MATRKRRVNRGRGEGSIFERSDGRWAAALADPTTGRRRYVYGRTFEAARDALHEMRATVQRGAPIAGRRETLGAFLEAWLERRKDKVRPRTHEGYASVVRMHVAHRCTAACARPCALERDSIGGRVLATLQAEDVDAFLTQKLKSGLSPRSVARLRQLLVAALRYAAKHHKVPRDISRLIEPVPGATYKPTFKPLDLDETRALLAAVRGSRLEAFVTTATYTGARLAELLGLQWSDVDFDAATIAVRRTLQRRGAEGWFCAPPKTDASARVLPIAPALVNVLRAHRARQGEARLRAGTAWVDLGLVFPTGVGTPQHHRAALRDFQTACARAGIRRVRLHDLRHACASQMLAAGVDVATVAGQLGHSSPGVTLRVYLHTDDARRRDAASRLAAALGE